MGQAQALGIAGTVCVAEGHGECPLPARLRTQVGEAPVSAVGRVGVFESRTPPRASTGLIWSPELNANHPKGVE